MYTAKYVIVALGVSQDIETRTISVFSILQDLQAEGFPVVMQRVSFVALLEKSAEDPHMATFRLRISAGTQLVLDNPIQVDFQNKQRANSIINVLGLVIPTPGVVTFTLLDGDRMVGEYTFNATPRRAPVVETIPTPPVPT